VTCLRNLLEETGPNGFQLTHGNSVITQASLLEKADHLRNQYPIQSFRPLFSFDSISAALPWLVAADGLSHRIGLASPRVSVDTLDKLKKLGGFYLVVPGDEAGFQAEVVQPDAAERGVQGATEWVLTTSGTTGIPKLVPHTLDSLLRTTKRSNPKGIVPVWGLLYSFDRFAGLQVLLQAVASGSKLIVPPNDASLSDQIQFMVEHGVTHLSASPTLWRRLLMAPASRELNLRSITLGGEIADQEVLDALSSRFPSARLVHIYASTEAGVGFSVVDKKAGFPVEFIDKPPAGVELRVRNKSLQLRTRRQSVSYIGSDKQVSDAQGWVNSGDLLERRGDRYLFVGRDDSTINVGGMKVQPEIVEQAIKSEPGIAEARVFGKGSAITGMLVCAEICLDAPVTDEKAFVKSLKGKLLNHLADHEMPVRIKIVENIEINASGKVERK